jgi:hypothetical protein
VPRSAGCCGTAACVGGVCVLPPTCAGSGMPCGAGCCAGLTCGSGVCNSPSRVTVRWDLTSSLISDGRGGYLFPSYIAHLIGSTTPVTHPIVRQFACATIVNGGATTQTVSLTARFGSYLMMDATASVSVGAGQTMPRCLPVAFNFDALRRLTVTTPGVIAATARDASGAEVANVSQSVAVMPLSSILIPGIGAGAHDVYDLAAVTVEPPQVRSIYTNVSRASMFTGGFGDSPYSRAPLTHPTVSVAAGSWSREALYLEAGETVQLAAQVAGGRDNAINAYLFTDGQYSSWFTGAPDIRPVGISIGLTTGPVASYTATSAGIHHLVLHNVAVDGTSRTVQWRRYGTRQEVATDALQAIYSVVRGLGFTYSNIPFDYFGATGQHVRMPTESLMGVGSGAGANCIDGTILFASLLELAGMEPVMIVVRRPGGGGHAYVGVKARPSNYNPSMPAMFSAPATVWAVETTMVGTSDFWDAFAFAGNERAMDAANAASMSGVDYHEIDVAALRRRGITPIP